MRCTSRPAPPICPVVSASMSASPSTIRRRRAAAEQRAAEEAARRAELERQLAALQARLAQQETEPGA